MHMAAWGYGGGKSLMKHGEIMEIGVMGLF